jgi:hypothetical protein
LRTDSASASSAASSSRPLEIEVHHRFARARLTRVQHAQDPAFGVTFEADYRVQHALDADVLRQQLRAHRVDEEGQIFGVGLEHRARPLVTVLRPVSD